jgi:iron-sulfur cluster repair protein YtfE (RIC family)
MPPNTPESRRHQRVPALDSTQAQLRPSALEIRLRERLRPGFHFSADDHREAFTARYSMLSDTFDELGIVEGVPLSRACPDPHQVLHRLALTAQPPYPWTAVSLESIADLVGDFVNRQHPTLRWEMARIDLLINRQAEVHNLSDLRSMRCGWALFHERLLDHLHEEEVQAFPLCLRLAGTAGRPLPTRWECAKELALMSVTHVQALLEIDEMLVLARRASLAVRDPDLTVTVRSLVAMRDALIVHTDLENNALLPRCLRLAMSDGVSSEAGF